MSAPLDKATDDDMAAVFGSNWEAIRNLVRRVAMLTDDEVTALGAAWVADRGAGLDGTRANAAEETVKAGNSADLRYALCAAFSAVFDAGSNLVMNDTGGAARYAALDSVAALIVRDLISPKHYAALTGPWASVIGPVHPDDVTEARP